MRSRELFLTCKRNIGSYVTQEARKAVSDHELREFKKYNPHGFLPGREKVPHMQNQLQRIIFSPLPPLVPCHHSSAVAKTIDNIIRNY
jgi:hypothetical protein